VPFLATGNEDGQLESCVGIAAEGKIVMVFDHQDDN